MLGIDEDNVKPLLVDNKRVRWVYPIKKPPVREDKSKLIYTPFDILKEVHFQVRGTKVSEFTDQYWTINMFQKAINASGKSFKKDFYLKSMTLEESTPPGTYNLILTANPQMRANADDPITVSLSHTFFLMFRTKGHFFNLKRDETLKIELTIAETTYDHTQEFRTIEVSRKLENNYYPTAALLVAEINKEIGKAMLEIAIERKGTETLWNFFEYSSSHGYVNFNGKKNFEILLDANILKMFHLPNKWLVHHTAGAEPVVLKTYKRNYLYVHCDCLDYYYINNSVCDIIKVVKNDSEPDEKTIISVQNPQYYAISRRYLSNINMYITDGLFENVLPFDKEVVFTLHFRKCLPFS